MRWPNRCASASLKRPARAGSGTVCASIPGVTERATGEQLLRGEVLEVDYDADTIRVRLDDGREETYPFQMFDTQDVYQVGQRFEFKLNAAGEPEDVADVPPPTRTTVSGYVESVDEDDDLVWVYIRTEEGWQRKVMPLGLFAEKGLDRVGSHFLLDLDEAGTPLELRVDESELEMLPQSVEETKPRWTNRPAAEAEPES
jgi:hypothetical protein